MRKETAIELISKITKRVDAVGEDAFLKGVFADVSLVNDIFKTYKQIMNKAWNVTCKSCYFDCYVALYDLTRINNKTLDIMQEKIYEIKPGVLLEGWKYGDDSKLCTNKNITNDLAEWFLAKDISLIKLFSIYPLDWHERSERFIKFKPELILKEVITPIVTVTYPTRAVMMKDLKTWGKTDKNTIKLSTEELRTIWKENKK